LNKGRSIGFRNHLLWWVNKEKVCSRQEADEMIRFAGGFRQWIYYLAAALFFLAVVLRALLTYGDSPILSQALLLLLLCLVLFISEPVISRRWSGYFTIYLFFQTALVAILLALPESSDFFATLLLILSMQAMLNLNPKMGSVWIAAWTPIMGLLFTRSVGTSEAIALTIIFTAVNIFMGAYALEIQREQTAQNRKLELALELQSANRQLQDYSFQLEHLAVARERNRFARELHDSVTQTVFSMNLTTQSALLLFERDPMLVKGQLERLSELVRSALAEMQALISSLKPEEAATPGLVPALRRHLAETRIAEDLSVSLLVEGDLSLTISEQQALLGIVQEALNNILKHAQTQQARVCVHLAEPCWMEIEDQGLGFDLQQARISGRMGLVSMQERAAEIGWNLRIVTAPGAGTRIRVEKPPVSEVQI
jgi:signal transduction histidine kinase